MTLASKMIMHQREQEAREESAKALKRLLEEHPECSEECQQLREEIKVFMHDLDL